MTKETMIERLLSDLVDRAENAARRCDNADELTALRVKDGKLSVKDSVKEMTNHKMEMIETENEAVRDILWRVMAIVNDQQVNHIKVDGYRGYWHAIDREVHNGKPLLLLEHSKYGDETFGLIVDEEFNVVLDEVWNGWSDYREAFPEQFPED